MPRKQYNLRDDAPIGRNLPPRGAYDANDGSGWYLYHAAKERPCQAAHRVCGGVIEKGQPYGLNRNHLVSYCLPDADRLVTSPVARTRLGLDTPDDPGGGTGHD